MSQKRCNNYLLILECTCSTSRLPTQKLTNTCLIQFWQPRFCFVFVSCNKCERHDFMWATWVCLCASQRVWPACLSLSLTGHVCLHQSAWLKYLPISHLHNNSTDRHTRTHAVYEYKFMQSHYMEVRTISRTQEHLQPLHLWSSPRSPSAHLNIHEHAHTDTQVATQTHANKHKQWWINGNQIVIMGLGETMDTMAKVCQCFPPLL